MLPSRQLLGRRRALRAALAAQPRQGLLLLLLPLLLPSMPSRAAWRAGGKRRVCSPQLTS
jgi:hypothetical protein